MFKPTNIIDILTILHYTNLEPRHFSIKEICHEEKWLCSSRFDLFYRWPYFHYWWRNINRDDVYMRCNDVRHPIMNGRPARPRAPCADWFCAGFFQSPVEDNKVFIEQNIT